MVHAWKETGEIHGPSKRTENAFRRAIDASGVVRTDLWPETGTHEQAVSLRVDGTRVCSSSLVPDWEWVSGTDDFTYWFADGELWVDDLKTGKYYEDRFTGKNLFPQNVRSAQLLFYALGIARLFGYTGRVHVSLTHWPRLPVSRRHLAPSRVWVVYEPAQLEEFYSRLERLYTEVQRGLAGDYTLNPGDHCRFCPSRNFCIEAESFETFNWRK